MEPLLNSSNLESSTTQKLSFFQIFFQKASRSEKKIIIFICLIFSMSSAMILGIPIVFQDPKIICTSTNEECSEEIACTEDYSIDLVTGPNSFSAEFGLICEKKSEKTLAITLGFVGVFIGCLMSTFILVSPQKRKSCLSFFGILLGASLLGMIVAEESFFIISLLVGLASFCFMFINTFAYLFIGENFEGELAGFVTIIYSVTWAFTGVFYSIFAYSINANWRIFVVLTGALSLFAGFGLLILKNEKDYESEKNEKEETMGIMSYFKDMWPNIQIRRNFIIYACFWSLFTMVYSVILIELGSVGGNLYVNMFLCSTLEIIAAIMAGALTANYNCTTVLKYLLTFLAIFLTVFLAAPPSLSSASPIEILIFIVCMFLAKFNNDILNLVTYLYLPKAFTDKYVGFWMLCSRFLSRFLGLFIPMISFMMRSVGLHPFCFYGICWIICRLFFNMTEEVQYEGVDDLLNDMQVNLRERLSVMSGSFSNGIVLHDDNLKNIHVDGMALSLIRRYKQEPGSFIGTEMVRIRDTIMRNSKVSLKKNIGMDVEMKEKE